MTTRNQSLPLIPNPWHQGLRTRLLTRVLFFVRKGMYIPAGFILGFFTLDNSQTTNEMLFIGCISIIVNKNTGMEPVI